MLINTAWRIDLAPQDWLAKDVLRQGVIFMTDIDPVDLDETGKVVLDAIYHQSTPIQFYQGVAGLDYIIPQLAHPVFEDLINSIKHRENKRVKLVDLGCSYGVNGALLKKLKRLVDFYKRFQDPELSDLSHSELIRRDRGWYGHDRVDVEIVGVDVSSPALDYAMACGLIDARIDGNFENRTPRAVERSLLAGADLMISTGAIGYISEKTIGALLNALAPNLPIMAHFVLRTFTYDEIAEVASPFGYKSYKAQEHYRQRRFASKDEQQSALARLDRMGVQTRGFEAEGWYYADLYLSLPEGVDMQSLPNSLVRLFSPTALTA